MFIFLSAKPRPSKKARLNKPADEDVVVEPEKTPDPEETNIDAILNDLPPQDHDFVASRQKLTPQAMLTSQPALSELTINWQVQLKILTNRQPQ